MRHRHIALTGFIGSGKSTVANILSQEYSFHVVECDALARDVANDPMVLSQIAALLGADCVTDGKLNRKKVREIVFADPELYKQYSTLFFDRVRELLEKRTEGLETVFVEIPVLSAFSWDWNEVWHVESSTDNCVNRVVVRDGVSTRDVHNILARQTTDKFTRIIPNNGSIDDLRLEVKKALQDAKLV